MITSCLNADAPVNDRFAVVCGLVFVAAKVLLY